MHVFPYTQYGADLIHILLWWSWKAVTTSASGCQQHKMDDGAWPKTKEQTQAFVWADFFFLLVITPPLVIGSGRRPSCRMQSWWIGLRVTHRDKTDERGEGGAERGTMTNSWKGKQGQMTYRIPSRAHTYLDLCKYTHQHCFGGTHFQFHYRYLLWSARELTLRTNAQPSDG